MSLRDQKMSTVFRGVATIRGKSYPNQPTLSVTTEEDKDS